jgi:coenzyme F420 hydrogenase subunit beta
MALVFGPEELSEDVLRAGLCIGCGACVALCPYFRSHKGRTAMLFACALAQGRCFAFCPKVEVDLEGLARRWWGSPYEGSPLGKHLRVAAARAGRNLPAAGFQSGGAATALMTFALETGRIDGAVLTGQDRGLPEPRLVVRPAEVAACAGSKFMAAPTLSALNQGVRQGLRRLGAVVTPCQATAVAQMRLNPLDREDFSDPVRLVIGLFCTWALDARRLIPLFTECVGEACVQSMDVPPPPAEIMVIRAGDATAEIPLERIRPLVPRGCGLCPDMTAEWADVSLGALEGESGWNTLIVRTPAGEDLVQDACRRGFLEVAEMPADNLARLCTAAAAKKRRAIVQARADGLLNTDAEGRRAALRLSPEAVARIVTAGVGEPCRS